MRFRRKTKLFPGVYLNFSKSGISTTIGVPGASLNIGKQGTFLNTGIPGTGIYDRQKIGGGKKVNQYTPIMNFETPVETVYSKEIGVIETDKVEETTTEGLQELKKTLLDCYQERNDLIKEISTAKIKLTFATIIMILSYLIILGFFVKWFNENRKNKKEYLQDLTKQLENCFVNIDMEVDDQFEKKYHILLENYKILLTCDKIWDITSAVSIDQIKTRSAAATAIQRRLVKFGFGNMDIIKSKYDALHFENANGGDLYIYPAFLAIIDSSKNFGLIDIRELDFDFHAQRFMEEEKIPKDADVVDHTWAKVNKNGTPDKRFKNNYQIPVCQYGEVEMTSLTGLNESYSFSSYEKSSCFAQAIKEYQKIIK